MHGSGWRRDGGAITRVIIASSVAFVDGERAGDRGAECNLDRDDDAALVVGVHDPAQAAQRDRSEDPSRLLQLRHQRSIPPARPDVHIGPLWPVAESSFEVVVVACSVLGQTSTDTLRGLSWIVNTYDEGGVVIAIEITLGAAIAGPFAIDKATLEAMITRVMAPPVAPHPLPCIRRPQSHSQLAQSRPQPGAAGCRSDASVRSGQEAAQ